MVKLDYQLGDSLWELMQRINILSNKSFSKFNLGYSQYSSLLIIGNNEGLSIKELAKIQIIEKSTAGKTIKKLEEKGFVKRVKSKKDSREFNLFLTMKGKKILPDLNKTYDLFLAEIVKPIKKKEREDYLKITKKINGGLVR